MNNNMHFVKEILKYTFGVVPIVAGFDKFTNILTDWDQYLSPGFAEMIPFESSSFMIIVGIIEMVAGVLVFSVTRLGAYIVSGWLIAIALTLIFSWSYVDVAVRDLVMAIAAFCLGKLSETDMGNLK